MQTRSLNSDPNPDPTKMYGQKKNNFTFVKVLKTWIRENLLVLVLVLLNHLKAKKESGNPESKKGLIQV